MCHPGNARSDATYAELDARRRRRVCDKVRSLCCVAGLCAAVGTSASGQAQPVAGKTQPVVGKTQPVEEKTPPVEEKASPGAEKAPPVAGPPEPGRAMPPAEPSPPPSAPPSPTEAAPCTGFVDGHAVDAGTHEPVAGATVSQNGETVTMTDEGGRFTLEGLCPGPLRIAVERADYELGEQTLSLKDRHSLELQLTPLSNEVIVIAGEAPSTDMRSTTVISGEALERTRGRSFAETLSEVPGVTLLRAGSGMSKPIVRGQFGRRLLMLVDGVRHRSQDWGIDHAPEIDPFVADRITVVRGAAGVQFGPDAIGGAVLADPPRLLRKPGVIGETHLFGIYGRGGSVAARVRGASARLPGLSWQFEGSGKRMASPLTPDYPLDNTGSLEWNLGATVGYRSGDTEITLSYRHYRAKLGVCSCLRMESRDDFYDQLEREMPIEVDLYRADMEIERSYQGVDHDMAIARVKKPLQSIGTLTGTYALQFDHRGEFDVVRSATGPQFRFRLLTNDVEVGLAHNPIHLNDHLHLRGSVGAVGMAQVHYYSGLSLVPDHEAWSGGAYLIERLVGHDFSLEAGLRYDVTDRAASIVRRDFLRLVRSGQLAEDACSDSDVDPVICDSRFHTISASIGGQVQLAPPWSVKLDLSTASRPPNPDEQYLNGTSPTFPVLGLGKPDLQPETTYSTSLTSTFRNDRVAAEASVYANYIDDYIYFAPAINENGEPIFDVLIRGSFPRFTTRPVDAVFYGFDGGVSVQPIPSLQLDGQLSMVRARNRTDDSFLVFVPPDRARGALTYKHGAFLGLQGASASIAGTYVARQDRFDLNADLAPPPPAYFLLDAEIGVDTRVAGQRVRVAMQGTNLLNARYRDYTSLLRYFADQPGWQLMLRLSARYGAATRF